jgi:hypothetical protein
LIDAKDVVLALLGASTALAGFELVFLGVVLTAYQSYSGAVADAVKRPYQRTAVVLFATFCVSLVTVAVCIAWTQAGGDAVYRACLVLFAVQLVLLLATAAWSLRLVLEWP